MAWFRCTIGGGGTSSGCGDLMLLLTSANGNNVGNPPGDLTDAILKTTATKIPMSMAYNCKNTRDISLANITEVGETAFITNANIRCILLPSCQTFGSQAFSGCGELSGFGGSATEYTDILNISSATSIAYRAFYNTYIKAISGKTHTLELASCETIGNDAFRQGSKRYFADVVKLPAIKTIGTNAFQYFSDLNKLYIGSACTSIGANAFANVAITELHVAAATPPTIQNTSFSTPPTTVYVPSANLAAYQSHTVWGAFNLVGE